MIVFPALVFHGPGLAGIASHSSTLVILFNQL
jgi:hypothetical protein